MNGTYLYEEIVVTSGVVRNALETGIAISLTNVCGVYLYDKEFIIFQLRYLGVLNSMTFDELKFINNEIIL